jgi:hypothetical protein
MHTEYTELYLTKLRAADDYLSFLAQSWNCSAAMPSYTVQLRPKALNLLSSRLSPSSAVASAIRTSVYQV